MTSLTDSSRNLRSAAARTLRQLRDLRQRLDNRGILVLSVVLIGLTGVLLYLLVSQTFKPYFNCAFLVGNGLNMGQLCGGLSVDLGIMGRVSVFPALNAIDTPLEAVRKFLTWNIILFFALLSIVLAYVAIKIGSFARLVLTPEGRKIVLTNVSVWLFFFVALCALFYINVVW